MYFENINRHLHVCGRLEVQPLLDRDRKFWNVISIGNPDEDRSVFRHHKRILHVYFHDAETMEIAAQQGWKVPTLESIQAMLEFADLEPRAPLLIHCHAGISRSSAFALALMLRGYPERDILAHLDEAIDQLITLRPIANPNILVLRLALSPYVPPDIINIVVQRVTTHPVIRQNTSVNPRRQ